MTGTIKGEVTLQHGDKTYVLRLDFNALADWEEAAGIDNAMTALQDPSKLSARQLRDLLWCGLRQNHPEIDKKTAGMIATMDTMNAAFASMAPDAGTVGNGAAAAVN